MQTSGRLWQAVTRGHRDESADRCQVRDRIAVAHPQMSKNDLFDQILDVHLACFTAMIPQHDF